jgi:hypothetical protein
MKYDITSLRAAAVERYRTTDWNAVLARGALLYLSVAVVAVYLQYIGAAEFTDGWTPAVIGANFSVLMGLFWGLIVVAPVAVPALWITVRGLVGRYRYRGVDLGALVGPPVLATVGLGLLYATAIVQDNVPSEISVGVVEAITELGELWLILTAWIALPWAVAAVVVTWHRRGPRIPTRAAVGVVLAACVVLAGVPAVAVAVTDTGAESRAEPADSGIEYNGSDSDGEFDYFGLARGTYQFDRGELACGPVERRPGTIETIQNATEGYEPVALHNVSEPVAVAPLVTENGTQVNRDSRWLVDLGLSFQQPVTAGSYMKPSNQPEEVHYGAYAANGESKLLWMIGEEVDFQNADRDELHLYWDVVHPNGTVHRYATKVCLPSDVS